MKKISKIILIIGVVAIIGTLGYLGWRYFFGKTINQKTAINQSATAIFPVPKKLSEDQIFDYWVNKNTGDIYYLAHDGQISKIDSSGQVQHLESKAMGLISSVKASNDGSSILVEFGYPQAPTFALHNLVNKTWQSLPQGTVAAAWDPKSSNRLIYLKDSGPTSRIYFYTPANQKSAEILRLAQKDLDLDWALPELIYFKERPSSEYASSLWSYNLKTKLFKIVARDENNLSIKWGTAGLNGIKLSGGQLSVIDNNNSYLAKIDLKTLPAKCTFAELYVYCAAPSDPTAISQTTFPDDYLKKSFNAPDDIYQIYILGVTSQGSLLSVRYFDSLLTGSTISADHLEIQKNRLIFINRLDSKLYSLTL